MLNVYVFPSLELLSHDFPYIRLLRGFRCDTLEVKQSFADCEPREEEQMNGSGA